MYVVMVLYAAFYEKLYGFKIIPSKPKFKMYFHELKSISWSLHKDTYTDTHIHIHGVI